MKRIAILSIAAASKPVYVHYIQNYWTKLIGYTNAHIPHIDVFLLFESGVSTLEFRHLEGNIIRDENPDSVLLCDPRFHSSTVPGVLSKTIYALDLLQDEYEVFFRTNLSSVIRTSTFDQRVQSMDSICYSGAAVWTDALRQDLEHYDRVGPGKSIESLGELDGYEGNTFVSGSGYFLSAAEARSLIERRDTIRYDLPDDVAVGLMFSEHAWLPGFSLTIRPEDPISDSIEKIEQQTPCHIRIEHFPLDRAEALWEEFLAREIWT
jgi:hypothetical protein